MKLNLTSDFKPLQGQEIPFESFVFNGGEPHIRIGEFDTSKDVSITHRLNSFNDIGLFLIAVDALRRMGVERIHAFIPYFPGARQDRVMVKGESLTVKVIANTLNALELNSITIVDPHSDVTPAVLDKCTVLSNHKFVKSVLNFLSTNLLLVSPDAGATKKAYKLAVALGTREVLECGKKRDVATGKLSGFKVPVEDLEGRPCLIVDDICDGGGTFLGLGEELKKHNSGPLYLAVTHGIFSKGLDRLSEVFDHIFTTDSFKSMETTEHFTQMNLSELI